MDKTVLKGEGPLGPLPACRYGLQCYRKNPSHFKEFFHPETHAVTVQSCCTSSSASSAALPEEPVIKKAKTDNQANEKQACASKTDIHEKLNFHFTRVNGLKPPFNDNALDIKDILAMDSNKCTGSVQFTYMVDFPWLIKQYPNLSPKCPLLIVLEEDRSRESVVSLQSDICEADLQACVQVARARLEIPYGTHHTKMMLLSYTNGIRIVIHTANLVEQDWALKTQGIFLSPLCPALSATGSGNSSTNFQQDLLAYLRTYRLGQLKQWIELIEKHDLSNIKVHLISSIPGRHTTNALHLYGHLKLKSVLKKRIQKAPSVVLAQFSSIGSLGAKADDWLKSEFLSSLCCNAAPCMLSSPACTLKLVYPCVDDVRCSLEGYMAGGSLPYSKTTAVKQPYLKSFMHKWKSDMHGRTKASPHIKSYAGVNKDNNLDWFLLTSANLSKAAWGCMEKKGSQLMIRSYELGVLWIPEDFGEETFDKSVLPFDYMLTPYGDKDEPWIVDVPCKQLPDTHGNMWCPGGR